MSRGYPVKYETCASVSWTILAEPRRYIELTFLDFDIYENPVRSCERDYIEVIDYNLLGEASPASR